MPPILALFACVLFVLVLLHQESKESIGVTRYLWVPTIWFLIVASRSLALWFGTGGATNEEGSIVDQWVMFSLFGIALATLIKRRFAWSVALREHRWLAFLLGFMLLSTIWSKMPFISFRCWFTYLIAIIMVLSVQTEPRPRVAAESILRRMVYICIPFSYLLIHYFPQYGKVYVHTQGIEMWTGVTIHKNSVAELCLIAFLLILWRIATRKHGAKRLKQDKVVIYLDCAVLLVALLVFMGPNCSITYSATSLLATAAGLGALGFLLWHKRRGTQPPWSLFITSVVFLIGYGTLTPFWGELRLVDVSTLVNRNTTLTGRTEVWMALGPAVMAQPWLGYGVGGFWTTQARELYDISGAHNGYLGVILETGFVGLVLCAAFVLSVAKNLYKFLDIDYNWGALCMMVLVATLSHNIGEESINSFTSRLMAVLLLLSVSCHTTMNTMPDTEIGRV